MKSSTIPLYVVEPYQLTSINTASLPLPQARKIQPQPVAEFCAQIAKQRGIPEYQYTENIYLPAELREQISARFEIPANGLKIDVEVAKNLVICDTGHASGKMVCTVSGLSRGKPIGIYSGEALYKSNNVVDAADDYEFKFRQADLIIPPQHHIVISAKQKSGFAGFMQDLVDPINSFTRDGDVAVANLLAIPFIIHGIGNALFIAVTDIDKKMQIGYAYGTHYWKTFSKDKPVKKEFFNLKGEIIPGLLLEEKLQKIKLLKSIVMGKQKEISKQRLAILLSVVPYEILDALSDEERTKLCEYAPSIKDIPEADNYAQFFPDYNGYDRGYLTRELLQAGRSSAIAAIHHVKSLSVTARKLQDREVIVTQSNSKCQKATTFYQKRDYVQALQHWTSADALHFKLYQHCGVIYYRNRPIPLNLEVVKLYWNIGNAYLNSGQYLNAVETLRIAYNLQEYFETPALKQKSLKDMSNRIQEAFDKLTENYLGGVGTKIQELGSNH